MDVIYRFLVGGPALVLILGVGLFLSIALRFPQTAFFGSALRAFFSGKSRGENSSFRALCTALSATVGTGNLVGVAGALCLGGPGAIFWMWISGLLGMVTKFAEATLAVRYRVSGDGGYMGGPMYIITRGLGEKYRPLAKAYCFFGMAAAFGVGNSAQVNAVISGCNALAVSFGGRESRGLSLGVGLVLAAVVAAVLLGGARRIGALAEAMVPFLAGGYILLCLGVLIPNLGAVPEALGAILRGAFSPKAVTGGAVGSAFTALRVGCSRGVFTNEAGMGTASIAHAGADVDHPVEQGFMGLVEVFLDTILICTLTALVILVSGVPIPYGYDTGGAVTYEAFATVYGRAASVFLAAALACFGLAAMFGWGLYGGSCTQFLFGDKAWRVFVLGQAGMVIGASVMDTALIWKISEILNGLMVIPNLTALAALTPELCRLVIDYKKKAGKNHADLH